MHSPRIASLCGSVKGRPNAIANCKSGGTDPAIVVKASGLRRIDRIGRITEEKLFMVDPDEFRQERNPKSYPDRS